MDILFLVGHVYGIPGGFVVLLILPDRRREKICRLKRLELALSILKDSHIERFLNIISDIVNILFIQIAMLLPR